MDTNIIKEYLIGLGFKVDSDSLNQAKQNITSAEGAIKKFANSNKENMSSMQKFVQLFSSSIKDDLVIVSRFVPEAKLPLLQMIGFMELLYKGIDKVSRGFKSVNLSKLKENQQESKNSSNEMQHFTKKITAAQPPIIQLIALVKELNLSLNKLSASLETVKVTNFSNTIPKTLEKTENKLENVSKESRNSTKALQELKNVGGEAVEEFAAGAGISIGIVVAGLAALVATVITTWKTLSSLSKQDLEYQKLAMQLWTTKENAREIDMALKTMKISMQDLWLSPELLHQFNQLRKDSAELKLPSDYSDNLKVVRNIVFEFQRLRQAGSLAFQWIGYYIGKYAAGPLANIHETLNKFTDGLLKNIPSAAKVIGTVLGIVFRIILTIIETLGTAIHPVLELIKLVLLGLSKMPKPMQDIIKLISLIGAVIMLGPFGAVLMLILALDDLFTAIKGGHSVIGSFFKGLDEKAKNTITNIIKCFKGMKDNFHKNLSSLKGDWDYYWDKAKSTLSKLEERAKKVGEKVKEFLKPWWADIKGLFSWGVKDTPEAKAAIKDFTSNISTLKRNFQVPSYLMPTTNKTSNSNVTNSSNTTNNFNIYGTNPTGTANAINSKVNNGIRTRNLQGVID